MNVRYSLILALCWMLVEDGEAYCNVHAFPDPGSNEQYCCGPRTCVVCTCGAIDILIWSSICYFVLRLKRRVGFSEDPSLTIWQRHTDLGCSWSAAGAQPVCGRAYWMDPRLGPRRHARAEKQPFQAGLNVQDHISTGVHQRRATPARGGFSQQCSEPFLIAAQNQLVNPTGQQHLHHSAELIQPQGKGE